LEGFAPESGQPGRGSGLGNKKKEDIPEMIGLRLDREFCAE
jgi:hypothetical protein